LVALDRSRQPIGLSASIQSNQTNLQIPIWLSDNVTLAPVFGISHQEDTFTRLNVGIAPRFYQDLGNDFGSYIGARGIIQHASNDVNDNDETDILLGATGGGEYFLDHHFSLGVEGQLNFFINDDSNSSFSTGAAVIGTYYF
jgi:hypothetical protein